MGNHRRVLGGGEAPHTTTLARRRENAQEKTRRRPSADGHAQGSERHLLRHAHWHSGRPCPRNSARQAPRIVISNAGTTRGHIGEPALEIVALREVLSPMSGAGATRRARRPPPQSIRPASGWRRPHIRGCAGVARQMLFKDKPNATRQTSLSP